ncbi:sensor histidine kinase [Aquabacter cavernae]|uniref:sensor histidine kinase n=1 Tax=Aquabacter cavernae TaxID=2496029 RepID=UPI000F8F0DC5|nr:HWE histidine kinase domain-containing protein [Aquabacter cavernae]
MSEIPLLTAAELRRRLEEAEETLRAIREGEIDALVIRREKEDEILTLEGPESYRSFMEAMTLGAAVLDSAFHLVYANRALSDMLGHGSEHLQAAGLFNVLDAANAMVLRRMTESAANGRRSAELRLKDPSGQPRHLLATATPLRLGATSGIAVTFTDVTERVRAAEAEAAEQAARAVIASANEAVVVCDASGTITHINPAVHALTALEPVGRRFDEALTLTFPATGPFTDAHDLLEKVRAGYSARGVEAFLPDAPRVKDVLVSAAPLVGIGIVRGGCVVTLVDLSARKAAERQQALLMGELDHRVRNTLALVLSICTLTGHNAQTVEEFQRAFVARVEALAATHTLLARKSWTGLSVGDVAAAELAPFVQADGDRLFLTGLSATVTPQAAVALGLIFHELATNAAKYGALSNREGRVEISGGRVAETGGLEIVWTERAGPPVAPPTRTGFGRTVITRSLSYSSGGAQIDFGPEGVVCTLRIPRSDLTDETPRGGTA